MLCFRKFPVAKKFMDRRGGGGYRDFPSKVFCLRVPNSFVGEPVFAVFKKISGSEKLYERKRGYEDFPSESFCLTVPKIFVGEHFCAVL